ncbi:hypothetical protein PAXINDRAFT_14139 [Paxillus involutus ATCC 200175]|uniref:Secreted protein n=1 Tax=Paxillus involutus ATCC 200175 TaxID=664439 RepID=A0A0C9TRQ6_PAXIN|nr:hypothetical protein PAXINDRAFT_14139 [Paxillus involutus ATCC 200175]
MALSTLMLLLVSDKNAGNEPGSVVCIPRLNRDELLRTPCTRARVYDSDSYPSGFYGYKEDLYAELSLRSELKREHLEDTAEHVST